MSLEQRPTTAIVLSLVGGSLMMLSAAMMYVMVMYAFFPYNSMGMMMGGYMSMMSNMGIPYGFISGLFLVGLVSGILVIIGAMMLRIRPEEHFAWGTIILVFSTISFLGMGGFWVGAILGIVGGAFALSWKPQQKQKRGEN